MCALLLCYALILFFENLNSHHFFRLGDLTARFVIAVQNQVSPLDEDDKDDNDDTDTPIQIPF